jgi:hypothetical protein
MASEQAFIIASLLVPKSALVVRVNEGSPGSLDMAEHAVVISAELIVSRVEKIVRVLRESGVNELTTQWILRRFQTQWRWIDS